MDRAKQMTQNTPDNETMKTLISDSFATRDYSNIEKSGSSPIRSQHAV